VGYGLQWLLHQEAQSDAHGPAEPGQPYMMGNPTLEASEKERDIGGQVNCNLKPSSQ
jgi:hypothetical protein